MNVLKNLTEQVCTTWWTPTWQWPTLPDPNGCHTFGRWRWNQQLRKVPCRPCWWLLPREERNASHVCLSCYFLPSIGRWWATWQSCGWVERAWALAGSGLLLVSFKPDWLCYWTWLNLLGSAVCQHGSASTVAISGSLNREVLSQYASYFLLFILP